ncbi:hypothetical protein Nmel_017976, partial [Mimus melanotis]
MQQMSLRVVMARCSKALVTGGCPQWPEKRVMAPWLRLRVLNLLLRHMPPAVLLPRPSASAHRAPAAPLPCLQARKSPWPATPLQLLQLPSPWTPKLALCLRSLASLPWLCTPRPALLLSTPCTPPAPLSTTPQQHHHPMSRHSPATLEHKPPRGPLCPPPASGTRLGTPGNPPGAGGLHQLALDPALPGHPEVIQCQQNRAALVPHTGPFVGAFSPGSGCQWPQAPAGGVPGGGMGGGSPEGCAPLSPCTPTPDSPLALLSLGVGIKPHLVPTAWCCL